MPSAYLLVSHGSRDSRTEIAMQHLASLVYNQIESYAAKSNESDSLYASALASPLKCETLVGTAYLELAPQPLHEEIKQFALCASAAGFNQVTILPLFLLPGVHVMEDIPTEVAQAEELLKKSIKIDQSNVNTLKMREAEGEYSARVFIRTEENYSDLEFPSTRHAGFPCPLQLQPHLGSHPGLQMLLAKQMADINAEAWIVVSHGSRRPGSQQPVEALAASLGAVAAYWAVPPSLEVRVQELIAAGYKSLGIIPYFLFAGGITDAIAYRVEQLKLQSPDINFSMAQPIGASADLANLIWDLIRE